ncbi:MAG: hypothetical protein HY319_11730 [Armatimonadetes bacterium]|nr:hypothetical protein [Armatimonadota bacterium]
MAAIRIEDLPCGEALAESDMARVRGGYQMEYVSQTVFFKSSFGVVTSGEIPATDMESTSFTADIDADAPTVVTISL